VIARPLRVGVIGARLVRQGVGEHLARFVAAAGGRVVAIAGTTASTVEDARRALETRWGIRAAGHVGAKALLDAEALDAVVIASPASAHREHLELALAARLHVLCEKPVLEPGADSAAEAARLAEGFAAAGRLLVVNEQWPRTLAAYRALFPSVEPARAARFRMLLAPKGTGAEALVGAMPHPLSVLDAVHPAAEGALRDVRRLGTTPTGGQAIGFVHPGAHGSVACSVELVPGPEQPRPASYAFDGHEAFRVVREPGYRLAFVADEGRGHEVALPDPMEALAADFVARASSPGPHPVDPSIARRAARLADLAHSLADLPSR
jgi:hypothetical protein